MSFFNNPQAMLMGQMFQNPQGMQQGGMAPPMPGVGGIGSGMPVAPSFSGPDGAPGVAPPPPQGFGPMPFTGPMPDFNMGSFAPGSDTGIREMQGMPNSPMPYRPTPGESPFGPMPAPRRISPDAQPMPYMPESGRDMGARVRPRGIPPAGRGGRPGPVGEGMPDVGSRVPDVDPSMIERRRFNQAREQIGPGVITEKDMLDRQRLIEALLRRGGGM